MRLLLLCTLTFFASVVYSAPIDKRSPFLGIPGINLGASLGIQAKLGETRFDTKSNAEAG
jgi:hypothetical protein